VKAAGERCYPLVGPRKEKNHVVLFLAGIGNRQPAIGNRQWFANISGRPTQIQQNSTGGLTFTNENGSVSGGYFVDLWHVVASGWGNLVGTIVGTPGAYTIYWANGTVWQE
jgi:hypothetical protein